MTEIVSWGVLYYAFPVLSDTISVSQHWSRPVLTAAFSLGLIVNALAGVDRRVFSVDVAGAGSR